MNNRWHSFFMYILAGITVGMVLTLFLDRFEKKDEIKRINDGHGVLLTRHEDRITELEDLVIAMAILQEKREKHCACIEGYNTFATAPFLDEY